MAMKKDGTRRALLVGVNKYAKFNGLNGCVNDVTNIRSILKTYWGYQNDDIRVLLDERATRDNIKERLDLMVKQSGPGDTLLFQFSGHGSQIRERAGEQDELDDGKDELICPHDMDFDNHMYLLDDDLNEIFKPLDPDATLVAILDCCHSGTGLKELVPLAPCGGPARLVRYLPPPVDIQCRYDGEEDRLKQRRMRDLVKTDSPKVQARTLWAACRSDQTSADAYITDAYNGAFTYYFCKTIRDANNAISSADLLTRVRASLKFNNFEQVPELEENALG